jgi:hypothetical protein
MMKVLTCLIFEVQTSVLDFLSRMDLTHIVETFIGSVFAFAFAWILQRQLIKRQERFQERMQKEQQDFQERLQKELIAYQEGLETQRTAEKIAHTYLPNLSDKKDSKESE